MIEQILFRKHDLWLKHQKRSTLRWTVEDTWIQNGDDTQSNRFILGSYYATKEYRKAPHIYTNNKSCTCKNHVLDNIIYKLITRFHIRGNPSIFIRPYNQAIPISSPYLRNVSNINRPQVRIDLFLRPISPYINVDRTIRCTFTIIVVTLPNSIWIAWT